MAIEAFNFIDGLVPTNPLGGDTISQGDDHLRGIKKVLVQTFPGASRPFRIPQIDVVQVGAVPTLTLDYNNRTLHCKAEQSIMTFTMPVVPVDRTFSITIMKSSVDPSGFVDVFPPSGFFWNNVPQFPNITIHTFQDPFTFYWAGSLSQWWFAYSGVPPNSAVRSTTAGNFGWKACDGSNIGPAQYHRQHYFQVSSGNTPTFGTDFFVRKC